MLKIGDRMKKLREDRGYLQQEVCSALGIEQSTLANYESNCRVPKAEILLSIAHFYRVPVDYLIGRQTDESNETRRIPVVGHVAAGIPKRGRL